MTEYIFIVKRDWLLSRPISNKIINLSYTIKRVLESYGLSKSLIADDTTPGFRTDGYKLTINDDEKLKGLITEIFGFNYFLILPITHAVLAAVSDLPTTLIVLQSDQYLVLFENEEDAVKVRLMMLDK